MAKLNMSKVKKSRRRRSPKGEPQAEAILITSAPEYKLIKSSRAEKYIE
jgi:hypothetical protein